MTEFKRGEVVYSKLIRGIRMCITEVNGDNVTVQYVQGSKVINNTFNFVTLSREELK